MGPSLSRMARIRLFLRSIFLVVAAILPPDVLPADNSIPEPQVHVGGVLGCAMLDGAARRSAVSSCTLARVYRCDLLSTNSFEGLVLRGGGDGGDDGLDIVKRTQKKSVHWLAFEGIVAHQVASHPAHARIEERKTEIVGWIPLVSVLLTHPMVIFCGQAEKDARRASETREERRARRAERKNVKPPLIYPKKVTRNMELLKEDGDIDAASRLLGAVISDEAFDPLWESSSIHSSDMNSEERAEDLRLGQEVAGRLPARQVALPFLCRAQGAWRTG